MVVPQTFLCYLLLSENSWGGRRKEEIKGGRRGDGVLLGRNIHVCCGRRLRGVEHCSHWLQDLSKHLLPTRNTAPCMTSQGDFQTELGLHLFEQCFREASLSFVPCLQVYSANSLCLPPQANKCILPFFSSVCSRTLLWAQQINSQLHLLLKCWFLQKNDRWKISLLLHFWQLCSQESTLNAPSFFINLKTSCVSIVKSAKLKMSQTNHGKGIWFGKTCYP